MLEEADQVGDRHRAAAGRRGQRVPGVDRGPFGAFARGRSSAAQGRRVEAERGLAADREVPGVERLERVAAEDGGPRQAAVGGPHRLIDRVEQLADRHRGRALRPGPRIGTAVEDQEVLGGAHDRVEQQLTVLTAAVPVADPRIAGQHVVAVGPGAAGKGQIVHPQQADHAVRDRTHRVHGADRQRAGAEVGPSGPAAETVREEGLQLGPGQHRLLGGLAAGQCGEHPERLPGLPAVGGAGGGEGLDRLLGQLHPAGHRVVGGERGQRGAQPIDELGQPADQLDVGGVDLVQRQRRADEVVALLVHGHPEQQPVQARRPGVLAEMIQPVRLPRRHVQTPADPTGRDQLGESVEVVGGEREAPCDRRLGAQIEDRGRLQP